MASLDSAVTVESISSNGLLKFVSRYFDPSVGRYIDPIRKLFTFI